MAGHGIEREREALMRKLVEVCGICWNFGKFCGLWRKEGNKEKGKKKKKLKVEDIFLDLENKKILKRQFPGFKSRMRKTFQKIPKSSRNQVSRNDS